MTCSDHILCELTIQQSPLVAAVAPHAIGRNLGVATKMAVMEGIVSALLGLIKGVLAPDWDFGANFILFSKWVYSGSDLRRWIARIESSFIPSSSDETNADVVLSGLDLSEGICNHNKKGCRYLVIIGNILMFLGWFDYIAFGTIKQSH